MVKIDKPTKHPKGNMPFVACSVGALVLLLLVLLLLHVNDDGAGLNHLDPSNMRNLDIIARPASYMVNIASSSDHSEQGSDARKKGTKHKNERMDQHQCPVRSISKLTDDEVYPTKGKRHMVTPPQGGLMHLVCCQTTKGPFNVLVHEKWAPIGAKRFLDMVQRNYFTSKVPLFRCIKGFMCQFGINSDPKLSAAFKDTLPDDINWLPEGEKFKKNKEGVKRFAHGYVAYAGSAENTRDNQLIVSLDNVETLGGGSPWEVPIGELVGEHSFETFSKMYQLGEDGPAQDKLWSEGVTKKTKHKFPNMDYVTGCSVVDQQVQVWE